jgi:predicted kinase
MASLYIIRGIPGSGKSTLAYRMLNSNMIDAYFEADMYMVGGDGKYSFDPARLRECHDKCFRDVERSLTNEHDVAVSNTFTRKWEMQRYIDLAKEDMHDVTIIVCQGDYKNVHSVPDEKVAEMKQRFEW